MTRIEQVHPVVNIDELRGPTLDVRCPVDAGVEESSRRG
jgi:hypothetical protein